jgi:tetratricopeptide (TPR) repeat protein
VWALTQRRLGDTLKMLDERENGTARLEEAVAAYRSALSVLTRDRWPLLWTPVRNNIGYTLLILGEREGSTARLGEAVMAYRLAVLDWTRDKIPELWAQTQNNIGNALLALGERESGTTHLEEAMAAYDAALSVNALKQADDTRARRERVSTLLADRKATGTPRSNK